MDRTIKVSLFFLTFFVVSTTLTAFAKAATVSASTSDASVSSQKPKPPHEEKILMRCIYTAPTSTATTVSTNTVTTTLPTTSIGFKFSLEKNNNNEIAVDSYSMNEKRQVIKQVGHSELISADAASITATTKAEAILANLSLAADSPLEFLISFSEAVQASSTSFSATVTVVTMFNGDIYENVPVTCGIQADKAPPAAASSSDASVNSSTSVAN